MSATEGTHSIREGYVQQFVARECKKLRPVSNTLAANKDEGLKNE